MPTGVAYGTGILLALPAIYVATVSGYLFLLTVGSMLYRHRTQTDAPDLRIAVLIPAHNEQHGIESVVTGALNLDYPPDKRHIFVISDNSDDDTAAIARQAGAKVYERHDLENRGKGQALDWCLKTHRGELADYDIIALVDADMTISKNFFAELSASFADPDTNVEQVMYIVSNPDETWRTALGFMSFAVINHLRPAGRCWLGGTAELKGSGMAFRSEILLDYGWPAHTIAEDIEFAKQLLMDGIKVRYNPNARVVSDIPTQAVQVETQQSRWEGGKIYLVKKYFPMFFKGFLKKPNIAYLDALLDSIVPPLTLLVALTALGGLASLLTHPSFTILFGISLALVATTIATALIQVRAPFKVWLYIAAIPLFMAWKIPLLFRVFTSKEETEWQRTPRDEELD